MKKFFTLCALVFATIFSKAQINEHFDNGFAVLQANCWEFPSMQYASSPAAYVINGNGSPYQRIAFCSLDGSAYATGSNLCLQPYT